MVQKNVCPLPMRIPVQREKRKSPRPTNEIGRLTQQIPSHWNAVEDGIILWAVIQGIVYGQSGKVRRFWLAQLQKYSSLEALPVTNDIN
jgi:hypothetical protein